MINGASAKTPDARTLPTCRADDSIIAEMSTIIPFVQSSRLGAIRLINVLYTARRRRRSSIQRGINRPHGPV